MNSGLKHRVEERLRALDLSPYAAARAMGRDRNFIKDILTGRKVSIRGDAAGELAAVLGVSVGWLIHGATEGIGAAPSESRPLIPVYGTVAGSIVGAFLFDDGAIDQIERPAGIARARDVYGFYVTGDSMSPRHRAGELRIADPRRPVRVGDDVVVITTTSGGQSAQIAGFRRRGAQSVVVEKLTPLATVEIMTKSIVGIHRVLTLNELMGVP